MPWIDEESAAILPAHRVGEGRGERVQARVHPGIVAREGPVLLEHHGGVGSTPANLGLDLDQHVAGRSGARPRPCGRRADRAEDLAVGAADRLPVGDVGDVDARAHDVGERAPGAPSAASMFFSV